MDLGQVGFVSLVVIVITDVVKEQLPDIKGNITRLIAIVIGGGLGIMSTTGIIPGLNIDVVGGVLAGVAAVAGNTLVTRVGIESVPEVETISDQPL